MDRLYVSNRTALASFICMFLVSLSLQGPSFSTTLSTVFFLTTVNNAEQIRGEEIRPADRSIVQEIRNHPRRLTPVSPDWVDNETLWLARAIYSETKRPEEQELVAWVVRNRVETHYRGRASYQGVVLDPYQFSAFNPGNPKRRHYGSLTPHSNAWGWQAALTIAHHVRHAEASLRPFSIETRHFYSEQSMEGRSHPVWAMGHQPVRPERRFQPEARRFRFFEGIS
jgi:hypothetical protein